LLFPAVNGEFTISGFSKNQFRHKPKKIRPHDATASPKGIKTHDKVCPVVRSSPEVPFVVEIRVADSWKTQDLKQNSS
jgi:hypothetical protein